MMTAMNLGSYLNSMCMNSEPMVDESLLSMRTNSAQNSRMFLLAMYPALVRIPFSILSMHSPSIDIWMYYSTAVGSAFLSVNRFEVLRIHQRSPTVTGFHGSTAPSPSY
jgi:hypothetical protein